MKRTFFSRTIQIACVKTHAILRLRQKIEHALFIYFDAILLNNVRFIYFVRMRKSHAIIRSEKITTHPVWMYPNMYCMSLIQPFKKRIHSLYEYINYVGTYGIVLHDSLQRRWSAKASGANRN